MSRFAEPQHPVFRRLNSSIGFDWRLAPYDIAQSRAHSAMLAEAGIISAGDRDELHAALDRVAAELDGGTFAFHEDDEDVHMAIERRLTEIAGPVGGKLHTARSRNDQVATDMAMKRQITREEMEDIIGEIKYKIPGICLRTTLISGFPGETQDDVEELKMFLQKIRFDRVGIFSYSHEEGTTAFFLEDNVPAEIKEKRAQEIMEVQQEISYQKNIEKIGRTFKVIIDKKEAGKYLGRTEFDSVEVDNEVIIKNGKNLTIGNFVNVKITNAYDYDLEGEVV